MDNELLRELIERLDAPQGRIATLERYATGTQSLAFLAPEAKDALGNRLTRMASNIPRLAVDAIASRLEVIGFTGVDIWDDWLSAQLDQLSPIAHREALTFGSAYVIVWARPDGRLRVTVESSKQVAVLRSPETGSVVAAVKRWCNTVHGKSETWAVMYEKDRITRWRSDHIDATASFSLVSVIENPLDWVPVVQLKNTSRLLDDFGSSEIDDLIPLVDALNKVLADMMVTSEFVGRPRRWATGIELVQQDVLDDEGNPTGEVETVSPVPEGDRLVTAENEQSKFGQLAAADLAGYEAAARVLLGQIMAVTSIPPHALGVTFQMPASAEAIMCASAGIAEKASARAAVFGRAWEDVARLVVAVRDGVDPSSVDARVQWAPFTDQSIGVLADAAVKLHQTGLLSGPAILKRLGLSDSEVEAELANATTPPENVA